MRAMNIAATIPSTPMTNIVSWATCIWCFSLGTDQRSRLRRGT